MPGDELRRGRAAFDARSWQDAYGSLAAADAVSPLEPDDLELLATSAYLTARHAECTYAWVGRTGNSSRGATTSAPRGRPSGWRSPC